MSPVSKSTLIFNMGIDDAVMHFGKYRGMFMRNVPMSYLQWLQDQDDEKAESEFGMEVNARDSRRIGSRLMSIPLRVAINYHVTARCSRSKYDNHFSKVDEHKVSEIFSY
jgi:uncharacterized protein (DUF3820 family)